VIREMALWPETLREIQAKLRTLHGIDHATIQPESDGNQKP
jgi:Co/Zn/Cd efflux system component